MIGCTVGTSKFEASLQWVRATTPNRLTDYLRIISDLTSRLTFYSDRVIASILVMGWGAGIPVNSLTLCLSTPRSIIVSQRSSSILETLLTAFSMSFRSWAFIGMRIRSRRRLPGPSNLFLLLHLLELPLQLSVLLLESNLLWIRFPMFDKCCRISFSVFNWIHEATTWEGEYFLTLLLSRSCVFSSFRESSRWGHVIVPLSPWLV